MALNETTVKETEVIDNYYTIKRKKVNLLSHVQLFATPCAVTYQAPLSMGFSRQEYWSGLPFEVGNY